MMDSSDIQMGDAPPQPEENNEPKYGGYSRFELELEVRAGHLSGGLFYMLTLS